MNREIFIEALKKSDNKDITKEDIMKVGAEYGIDLPKRMARYKVIDIIAEEKYEALESAFAEFLYVPSWVVADFYGLTSERINKLNDLGIIKETAKPKEIYSRRDKDYFTVRTYPLSVFDYDKEYIKESYEQAYGGNWHRLRIEIKTEDQLKPLLDELEKIFEITKAPETHEHRNNNGYYSYFNIKTLNNSDIQKDVLRLEIDNLNKKIAQIKEEEKKKREKVIERVFDILEISGDGYGDLYTFKRKFDDVQKENEQLRAEAKSWVANASGRKSRFTSDEKNAMYMNHLGGKSIRAIAADYDCSVGLVHKIIKEKKIK